MPTQQARMTTYFGDETPSEVYPCEVRIDGDEIIVSYDGDAGPVVYSGKMKGEGHFELKSARPEGRACLHRFWNGRRLDGWWKEDGYEGMWRITF